MNGFPISAHQRFKTSTFSYLFQLFTLHEVAIPKGRCCDRLWDELSFLLFTWWNPHVPVTWSCWNFGSKLSIDSQKFVACPHLKDLAMSQLGTTCCKDSVANVSSVGLIQGMIEYIPWHQWERNPSVLLPRLTSHSIERYGCRILQRLLETCYPEQMEGEWGRKTEEV